jgi:hypothetical protein
MRTVIGLTGFAGAGKDEAANALINERGFVKVSFAEPMRTAMAALNPYVGTRFHADGVTELMRYREVAFKYGYDDAKRRFPEIRELMQKLGTEVGRGLFGENFWVGQAKRLIDSLPDGVQVVITDVRFPNELEMLRSYYGLMVRVERPGVEAVNGHVSEQVLPHDVVLTNRGTVEDLHRMIIQAYENRFTVVCPRARNFRQLELPFVPEAK